MDVELLSRLQFAFTIAFHYIFPPLSIGLGVILVISEAMYIKTKNLKYETLTKFWVKIFALTFGIGVATGIVMEFEFGTNWATYSRFVGDVFGSLLAAEGIFAFFLESGFLAILLFGWNKVKPGMHFFSTIMVCFGAHLSAVWILVANSWQQTPGVEGESFKIIGEGIMQRAEIIDFWQVVFNPSSIERIVHTVSAAWLAGAFLVLSVSAYYLLKNREQEYAELSIKIGLVIILIASFVQIISGHESANVVAEHQPAKLAAFEGHYETGPADLYLLGWVDDDSKNVVGVKLPGMLSWLIHFDTSVPVKGLNDIPSDERPPVNIVFQAYHLMVAIGFTMLFIALVGSYYLYKGNLSTKKFYLKILMFSVLLPQAANQLGWIAAEVGRQPWIVYGYLKTKDALSNVVSGEQVLFSLIMFGLVYLLLFFLFLFLLDRKIKHGFTDLKSEEYSKQELIVNRD